MFQPTAAFSGFSVKDLDAAKAFYREKLGLEVKDYMPGGARIALPRGAAAWMYEKSTHEPATYTMLNFIVDDIDAAVTALKDKGVEFEMYEGMHQDEHGIARGKAHNMGPDIAWFKDPSGNILAVLAE